MYTQNHCLYSPSSLERRFLCPGSAALESALPEHSSPEADSGTRIHAAIAGYIQHKKSGEEGLHVAPLTDEAEGDIYYRATEWLEAEMQAQGWDWSQVSAEERLEYRDAFGLLYWGTADVVVRDTDSRMLTIVDWKTGFLDVAEAKDNWQGAAYALCLMSDNPGCDCRVIFQNLRTVHRSEWTYLASDYSYLSRSVCAAITKAKQPNAPRRYGETQCRYCKAAAQCVCPEFNASRMAVAAMGSETMKIADMSDSLLAEYYQRCKLVARASELIEAEMRKRIEEKGEVAGYRIKKVSGGFDCDDLPSLYTALGDVLEQKDFLECCKVSVTNLRDLWARKAKDCGVCKSIKAAKDQFMLDVANLLVERSPRIWITKDKEKE